MVSCSNCGAENPEDAKFCGRCGASLISPSVIEDTVESRGLINRMIRAMKLDASLYEEVEKDETATNQSLLVTVIASVCVGIGLGIRVIMGRLGLASFVFGIVGGTVTSLIGWLIWSFLAYIIGAKLLKGPETEANYGQLLRAIGFSRSPGVISILSFMPIIGGSIAFVASIWALIAMVIAVRQALDFSTARAVATCVVGFIVYILILTAALTLLIQA